MTIGHGIPDRGAQSVGGQSIDQQEKRTSKKEGFIRASLNLFSPTASQKYLNQAYESLRNQIAGTRTSLDGKSKDLKEKVANLSNVTKLSQGNKAESLGEGVVYSGPIPSLSLKGQKDPFIEADKAIAKENKELSSAGLEKDIGNMRTTTDAYKILTQIHTASSEGILHGSAAPTRLYQKLYDKIQDEIPKQASWENKVELKDLSAKMQKDLDLTPSSPKPKTASDYRILELSIDKIKTGEQAKNIAYEVLTYENEQPNAALLKRLSTKLDSLVKDQNSLSYLGSKIKKTTFEAMQVEINTDRQTFKKLNNDIKECMPKSSEVESRKISKQDMEKTFGANLTKEKERLVNTLSHSGCNIEDVAFFIGQIDKLAENIQKNPVDKKSFSPEKFKTAAYLIASSVIPHSIFEADDKPLHAILDFIGSNRSSFLGGKEAAFSHKIAGISEELMKNSPGKMTFTSGESMAQFFLNPIAQIPENKLDGVIKSVGPLLGKHQGTMNGLDQYTISSILSSALNPVRQ